MRAGAGPDGAGEGRESLQLAFLSQRSRAKRRGIGWMLSFEEWLRIWVESGHLSERGRGCGKYVMARHGDVGEQRRVSKIRARPGPEIAAETMTMPLADASVTLSDIEAFWSEQPFKLELKTVNGRTLDGNCDLCFLKPAAQVLSLVREQPARAVWWARMESLGLSSRPDGSRFRNDRPSYAQMAAFARDQRDMFDPHEEAIECFCGD